MHPRMKRELQTIKKMVSIYCHKKHATIKVSPCPDCQELLDYAISRLHHCPFQEGKTTCGKCPIHCYKPNMREKIRAVMRFSGPLIPFHHPILAFGHMVDGMRKKPIQKKTNKSQYKEEKQS